MVSMKEKNLAAIFPISIFSYRFTLAVLRSSSTDFLITSKLTQMTAHMCWQTVCNSQHHSYLYLILSAVSKLYVQLDCKCSLNGSVENILVQKTISELYYLKKSHQSPKIQEHMVIHS